MRSIHSKFGEAEEKLFIIFMECTVKSESIHSVGFGFSSISPSNLGQISKSGTVLKS